MILKMSDITLFRNNSGNIKAIDVRRKIVNYDIKYNICSSIEKQILNASVKTPIAEIPDNVLIEKTRSLFRYIAFDVGYNIPDDVNIWAYACTRLLDMLKKYFSTLSLSEIKIAFEFLLIGELNNYLPKDKAGNADKSHYQNFNIDYFSRVLNAYLAKKNSVISHVYNRLNNSENKLISNVKESENIKNRCRYVFLKFKYKGVFELDFFDEMFVYEWLCRIGLSEGINLDREEDRKEAFCEFLSRASSGLVNKFTAAYVRNVGKECKELDNLVYKIARRKEIKRVFELMCKEEIQL